MTSKFFTWTKGDRRNASEALQPGGIVPIPVECISIKGLDYSRTSKGAAKAGRRPLPLLFDRSDEEKREYESVPHSSVALHDAAVQSATSLMVVMNDMLKSPPLSAHVFGHPRPGGPTPMYGRPRSHTAPTTPLVEAPTMEPVELSGSPLVKTNSHNSFLHTVDSKVDVSIIQTSPNLTVGNAIVRPHTSPQESTFTMPQHQYFSAENLAQTPNTFLPASITPRSKTCSPHAGHRRTDDPQVYSPSEARLTEPGRESLSFERHRPSLSVLPNIPLTYTSLPTSRSHSHDETLHQSPQPHMPAPENHGNLHLSGLQSWIDEISRMRTTQQAHVDSLKEAHETYVHNLSVAHEKEMASYRSYINILENRHTNPENKYENGHQTLGFDRPLATGCSTAVSATDNTPTTSRSFESTSDVQKRVSQETLAEIEALKRKLSLSRKAQIDAAEIRRERDQFRIATERSDRRIAQLKDIVRKAKENDAALKSELAGLQARLVAANNQRLDVLEGFHEACEKIRVLSDREGILSQELDEAQSRLYYAHPAASIAPSDACQTFRTRHNRAMSDVAGITSYNGTMLDQTSHLQRLVAQREARIKELEQILSRRDDCWRAGENDDASSKIVDLERQLEEQKEKLSALQAERDRYTSLLHSELRRQARQSTAQQGHIEGLELEAGVIADSTTRTPNVCAASLSVVEDESALHPNRPQSLLSRSALERDLNHCINEIIMYKLDVKGYKKDLRKAHAKISTLEALKSPRPPTPDSSSVSSLQKESLSDLSLPGTARRPSDDTTMPSTPAPSGLGISPASPPHTPLNSSIAVATAVALNATLPSPRQITLTPRSPRSRAALASRKKLPRPPCAIWPEQDVQRTETLRSVSESIISSYTKRAPQDTGPAVMPVEVEKSDVFLESVALAATVAAKG